MGHLREEERVFEGNVEVAGWILVQISKRTNKIDDLQTVIFFSVLVQLGVG